MADLEYLKLLSAECPNIRKASAEIINLNAILALPKGTEYFLSDLHGEHEAFIHMIKSASGIIRRRIDEIYGKDLTRDERDHLAALIYNAKAEMARVKKEPDIDFDAWCRKSIYLLTGICRAVSTKYSRSRVRRRLPKNFEYIIDELLHADDEDNRSRYYSEIINSIIKCGIAEEFIEGYADSVSMLACDQLHIIGDIFDRGSHPDKIMDYLLTFHDVDFQWGNHDILWMGAATGNWACIANVIRNNISYNNFDMLEIGYGINLRPLATFAQETYRDDDCVCFKPHVFDENKYDPVPESLAAKMNKAISICQFKVEGQRIKAHPEYHLEHRLLLDKLDLETGTITLESGVWPLRDTNFPTVDPADPYRLTEEETKLMNTLEASFLNSEKLQEHIRFLFSHGAMYQIANGNLLYHGCIPMTEDGQLEECTINGKTLKGKAYFDFLDAEVRKAYFTPKKRGENGHSGDLMWYLWLGAKSPLFGKDQMTTFERFFIEDKTTHKENTVPYYRLINERSTCEMILKEFGCDPEQSKILSGHVPVKVKDGASPIKGDGLCFIIDGGISKAYQKDTGIAGYTFIFNSRFMALAEHKPYSPLKADGTQEFFAPTIRTVDVLRKRMYIADTDDGVELKRQVEALKELVEAYRTGAIKETY